MEILMGIEVVLLAFLGLLVLGVIAGVINAANISHHEEEMRDRERAKENEQDV